MSSKAPSVSQFENEKAAAILSDESAPSENVDLPALPVAQDWTEAEEKALVRKLDFRIIPMMALVFAISLLDRANISAAYISGMNKNLQMTIGARYSIALLVFFPAYVIFQLPSNLIIRRVGARFWLSFLIVGFGVVVLCMGFVKSWISMAVLRALLGAFEAGLLPGCIYLVASWYRTFETAKRINLFYMAAITAVGFGGILAYGLQTIRVGNGIYKQGWRWIYIIEGLITLAIGAACFFTVPQFAEKATWLSDRERHIASTRITLDRGEKEWKQTSTLNSVKLMRDPKLLVSAWMYFATATSSYAISFFFPIILTRGIGFKYTTALILTSTPYFSAIIGSMILAWLSDKYHTRWQIIIFQTCAAVLGLLMVLLVKVPGVRLLGIFIAVFGVQGNAAFIHVYAQSQVANPEKRSMSAVAIVMAGAIGGVAGSTIFRSQDAPKYLPGMWTAICLNISILLCIIPLTIHLKRKNRLLAEGKISVLEGVVGFTYSP